MAYRNQNYMTNRLIKQEVDKNQKGYESSDDEGDKGEEIQEKGNITFNISFYGMNLDNASITLKKDGSIQLTATTDDNGVAQIKNINVGQYTYSITREHCIPKENVPINVKKGEQTVSVELESDGTMVVGSTEPMIEEEGEF